MSNEFEARVLKALGLVEANPTENTVLERLKAIETALAATLTMQLTGSNFEQTPGSAIPTKGVLMGISDGTNLRAMNGNLEGTLLANAARTATTNSPDQTNYNARGVHIVMRVNPASGTGGLTLSIYGKDPISGLYYSIFAAGVVTTAATYSYELYPGSSGAQATLKVSGSLPRTWRIGVAHGDASSYTYSVSYSLIV